MATNKDNNILIDESTLDVPRGFLIALDKNGNYVPFLVKVRDSEIIYTDAETTDVFDKVIENFKDGKNEDIDYTFETPTKEMVIKKNNWTYYIKPNGHFHATYQVEPDESDWETRYRAKRMMSPNIANNKIGLETTGEFLDMLTYYADLPIPVNIDGLIVLGNFNMDKTDYAIIHSFKPYRRYTPDKSKYDSIRLTCEEVTDKLNYYLLKVFTSQDGECDVCGSAAAWNGLDHNNQLPLQKLLETSCNHQISIYIEGFIAI